ncbi:MAG: hypothetical protein IKV48_00490, partial [Eggerthellaceae bacterium]|nr:hypothetical protein [Eggerthellaceae bacterium]
MAAMGFFRKLLGLERKKDPRQTCDWDVYYQDFNNGMPWGEQQKKLEAGLYEKGIAKPDPRYGFVSDIDRYNADVERCGRVHAELLRRIGC